VPGGERRRRLSDVERQFDYIEDDVLRLIFLSCHPTLTPESRAAANATTGRRASPPRRSLEASSPTSPRWASDLASEENPLRGARRVSSSPEGRERAKRLDDVMA